MLGGVFERGASRIKRNRNQENVRDQLTCSIKISKITGVAYAIARNMRGVHACEVGRGKRAVGSLIHSLDSGSKAKAWLFLRKMLFWP